MRVKRTEADALTLEQRERLRALLEAVPADAAEDHPAFVELLEEWWAAGVLSDAGPTVPCYKTKGGVWVVASVLAVMDAIGRHVGSGDGRAA